MRVTGGILLSLDKDALTCVAMFNISVMRSLAIPLTIGAPPVRVSSKSLNEDAVMSLSIFTVRVSRLFSI